jgi:hypothetical protein
MGAVFGQLIPFAVGIALSPIPVIAVILILFTPKAKTNGPMFLLGWFIGILVIGGIVVAIGGSDAASGDQGTSRGWLELLLGVLLLVAAAQQWRSRPKPGEQSTMPKWMSGLDRSTAGRSLAGGGLLSSVNPKNLLLAIGASNLIATSSLHTSQQWILLLTFAVLASVTVALPVVYVLVEGGSATETLTRMKSWLSANNTAVMAVVLLVLGAKLVGDALSVLSA